MSKKTTIAKDYAVGCLEALGFLSLATVVFTYQIYSWVREEISEKLNPRQPGNIRHISVEEKRRSLDDELILEQKDGSVRNLGKIVNSGKIYVAADLLPIYGPYEPFEARPGMMMHFYDVEERSK